MLKGADDCIDQLEQVLEQKYLRYCDPINPLHMLVTVMCRTVICSMRIRAHHPSRYKTGSCRPPPEEHAKLFNWSLKALRYDGFIMTSPTLTRYHWHIANFFQYHPIIHLFIACRYKLVGSDVDAAWAELKKVYVYRPRLLERS